MSENISRRGAVKLSLVTMVVTAAVAVPTAVWANHQFNDVPSTHPFHDQITAVAGAGITTGFPDGGFHPSDPVTRQAMAAFLERGIGRIGSNTSTNVTLGPSNYTGLTGVFIDAGATGGGTGFVELIGTAQFTAATPADCPCRLNLEIVELEPFSVLRSALIDIGGDASESGNAATTGTVQTVVEVAADSTRQFGFRVYVADSSRSITADWATLSASYVPLGPDGDDTLAYCSAQEEEPNDAIAQADPVIAVPIYGCIEPGSDVDWFKVTISDDEFLTVATSGLGGFDTCDTDTYVRITNSNGGLFRQDNETGPGPCAAIYGNSIPPGTYYVAVSGSGPAITGSYRLVVEIEGL